MIRQWSWIVINAFLLVSSFGAGPKISDHPEVVGNIKLLEAWIQMAYRCLPRQSRRQ